MHHVGKIIKYVFNNRTAHRKARINVVMSEISMIGDEIRALEAISPNELTIPEIERLFRLRQMVINKVLALTNDLSK